MAISWAYKHLRLGLSVRRDGVRISPDIDLGPLGHLKFNSLDGVRISPDIDLGPLGHLKFGSNINNMGQLKSVGIDVAVNTNVVSVNVDTEIDSGGDISGGVGGRVNVSGVEVGANVVVDKRGQVSGGGSVRKELGPIGVVDVHAQGGPDGASVGVGYRGGYVPASCNLSVDVNDRSVASADIRGGVDVGPASVKGGIYGDTQGRVRGNAGVSSGEDGASIGVQYDNENDDDEGWSLVSEPSIVAAAIRNMHRS